MIKARLNFQPGFFFVRYDLVGYLILLCEIDNGMEKMVKVFPVVG